MRPTILALLLTALLAACQQVTCSGLATCIVNQERGRNSPETANDADVGWNGARLP